MVLTGLVITCFVFFASALASDPECTGSVASNGQHGHCATVSSCPYSYFVSGLCPSYGHDIKCCYNCHLGGCQMDSNIGTGTGTGTDTGTGTSTGTGTATQTGTSPYADVRATWLSRYDHATSLAETAATFATLKAKGINRVYLNVWASGQIYFQSRTFESLGIRGFVRDVLGWAVEEGQKNGIEVWAWFEYGLKACWGSSPTVTVFSNKVYGLGWIKGQAGEYWWMDAGNTQVLDFLAGMMQDAVDNYPGLAGVQLDDHFVQPWQLGTGLVATMTNAARHILGQVSGRVSLSPIAPPSLSLTNYNVDWASWARDDIGFHEYVPQIYREDASVFNTDLDRVMSEVGKTKLVPGLRCIGSGSPTTYSALSQMISRCEAEGVGYSVWYSRCFTLLYTDLMLGGTGAVLGAERGSQDAVTKTVLSRTDTRTPHWISSSEFVGRASLCKMTPFVIAIVFLGLASANDPECATSSAHGQQGHCVTVESCPYGYYVSGKCPSYGDEVKCCYSCHYGGCQTNSSIGAGIGTLSGAGENVTSPYADVRATWMSQYDHANTQFEMAVTFAQLQAKGINRVYLNVWADGQIYFRSPTFESLGIRGFVRDVLGWAVEEGLKRGIEVWAWFEYGLIATWGSNPTASVFSTTVYNKGWMKGEAKGYWWLDAGNFEVLDFVAGMMQDAFDNYPGLGGVQLDEHFGQPYQLGSDLVATVNDAVVYILEMVSGKVSMAPVSPPQSSLLNFNMDWARWASDDIGFHEYVPKIYRDLASTFDYDLTQIIAEVGKDKLIPGIRCIGSGANTPYNVLSDMMDRCEAQGLGHSVWYSKCFTLLYPDHVHSGAQ
ncbi:uncharacterized protein LOC118413593 [Branchiostoma floridae]|uniref:Uncharacterized protein LOC118413593 n=1 Tax=Branchiostoma floridae TaxID=7739 RepID=A0A9J7KYU4_BRAFL|nr:uncharacterized protein LOC118413593 [Branchiostoma floridae]